MQLDGQLISDRLTPRAMAHSVLPLLVFHLAWFPPHPCQSLVHALPAGSSVPTQLLAAGTDLPTLDSVAVALGSTSYDVPAADTAAKQVCCMIWRQGRLLPGGTFSCRLLTCYLQVFAASQGPSSRRKEVPKRLQPAGATLPRNGGSSGKRKARRRRAPLQRPAPLQRQRSSQRRLTGTSASQRQM